MRRFYNLREWKELLIACITDVCLWVVRRINQAPNNELAYRIQDMAYNFMPVILHAPTVIKSKETKHEYVFWEQN